MRLESLKVKSGSGAQGRGNEITKLTRFGDKIGSGHTAVKDYYLDLNETVWSTNSGGYQYIHHEMYHGLNFEHDEGMSYGWSDTIQNAADQLDTYTIGENKVIEVPHYIMESKYVENDKIQLTVHKTSDATQSDMTFEVLSSSGHSDSEAVFEKGASDGVNQVTFSTQNSILGRHFVRVYANDSDEVMSLFIRPSNMTKTKLVTDANKTYHAISNVDWKRSVEIMDTTWKVKRADGVCKAWLGEDARVVYEEEADHLNSSHQAIVDGVNWLDSKKFVAGVDANGDFKVYDYSGSAYVKSGIGSETLVNDDTLGILCVE